MATYKLIQDIEAEDHILGPLSLRQFIFALIAAFLYYICFIVFVKHVAFLLVVLVPPALFCTFFAFPFGGDQPTELWALAKLRFWFKPRRRIWSQSGVKELVTITVPKKIEHVYSDGLSQTEVKSRLQALANTIDSRGWAIKHVDALGYAPQQMADSSDRLLDITDVPQEVPDSSAADDMLDTDHNPIARQFDSMITQSSQDHRQRLIDQLRNDAPAVPAQAAGPQPSAQWFMSHSPAPLVTAAPAVQAAEPTAADEALLSSQLKSLGAPSQAYGNLRTIQPLGAKAAANPVPEPPLPTPAASAGVPNDPSGPMTARNDPAILSLSKNNDLNVATLAREAHRAKHDDKGSQDEVVISLH